MKQNKLQFSSTVFVSQFLDKSRHLGLVEETAEESKLAKVSLLVVNKIGVWICRIGKVGNCTSLSLRKRI